MKLVENLQWFRHPSHEHIVQFYETEDILYRCLEEYVRTGLESNEVCLLIVTPEHMTRLEENLRKRGVDIEAARASKQLITIDARQALEEVMSGSEPDWDKFVNVIGRTIENCSCDRNGVRAFGEMVALLWGEGKQDAVLRLEDYWNKLTRKYKIAAYNSYPSQMFGGTDQKMVSKIKNYHSLAIHI